MKNWNKNLNLKKGDLSEKKIPYFRALLIALVVNLLLAALVLIFNSHLPPEIPLFYGLAYGRDQLASSYYLTLPSIISIVFIVINTAILLLIEDKFLKKTLAITAISTTLLSFITTLKIALVVGSFNI